MPDRQCMDRPKHRFGNAARDKADEVRSPAFELLRKEGQTGRPVGESEGSSSIPRLVQRDVARDRSSALRCAIIPLPGATAIRVPRPIASKPSSRRPSSAADAISMKQVPE